MVFLVSMRDDGGGDYKAAGKVLRDGIRAAGLKGKTVHDLRRTFAQRLKRRGVEDRAIAMLLGQASTSLVDRYTEVEMEALRRAVGDKSATSPLNPAPITP